MASEIKESDWKVFRELRETALDRFCWRALDEIQRVSADSTRSTHQRYLAVYELIRRRDRELAATFDDPRRSTAFLQLLSIQSQGLLTEEEMGRFSQEIREALSRIG